MEIKKKNDALRQRLDEFQDISIPTGLLNLFHRHFQLRFDSPNSDVESNGTCVKCGFLRYQRKVLSVFLDIQFVNAFTVKLKRTARNEQYMSVGCVEEKNRKGRTVITPADGS